MSLNTMGQDLACVTCAINLFWVTSVLYNFRHRLRRGEGLPEAASFGFRIHLIATLSAGITLLPSGRPSLIGVLVLFNVLMWYFVSYLRRRLAEPRRVALPERVPNR